MTDVEVAEVDPVCGMKVLPQKAAASVERAGRTWYFCSLGCRAKFEADPGKYDGSAPLVSISSVPISSSLNTPAPCIQKSCGQGQALARSAAWRWSRAR